MARLLFALSALYLVVSLTTVADPTPNLERALAAQQELVVANPLDPQAHNDLGNLYALAGREADAEAEYRRALELDPRNATTHFNLAVLMQQQRRFREAHQGLLQVLEISPRHAWAHYQLGMLAEERNQRAKAIEYYARAFAYDTQLTFARHNPHIIDNRLSTEALLVSQRYREAPSTKIPRQYADPSQITEWLLYVEEKPEIEIESNEAETETTAEAETMGPKASQTDSAAERRVRPRNSAAPRAAAESRPDPGKDEDRALTQEDLPEEGSRVRGLAVGVGQPAPSETRGETPDRRGTRTLRRSTAGSTSREGSARRDRGQAPTRSGVAPARPRYRPGRESTGRLDLDLLPQEEETRYAGGLRPSPAPAESR